MLKIFSFNYMMQSCGCYGENKTKSIFFSEGNDGISIETIMSSSIPLKDKFWFLIRKTELTPIQKKKIAIDVAEIVLPLYEKRYPDNNAPREAIEAAKQFLSGHISLERLIEKRHAAAAAADDDDAAYAAAYDAYDAAYAAYAAAAYAAYAAADDDAAAADDDAYRTRLIDYLNNFIASN